MSMNPLQCDECPKYFADAAALKRHKLAAMGHSSTVKLSLDTLMPTNYDEQIKSLERQIEAVTWEIDSHYRTIMRMERLITAEKARQEVLSHQLFELKRGNQ